jgi:hypothetical protein
VTPHLYTIEEVAGRLRKSRRWLQDFLRSTPRDHNGIGFYHLAGRTKLFTEGDIARIVECLPCPSNSFEGQEARTGISAAPSEAFYHRDYGRA